MVFAVKAGISGLLDVARATYCQTIEGKSQFAAVAAFSIVC